MTKFLAFIILVLNSLGRPGPPVQAPRADLVLTNARVWTAEPTRPWAEAIAIRGNRIVEVASSDEVQRLIGEGTEVIDAGGKLAIPGINDAHTHFLRGSMGFFQVDLTGVRTLKEAQDKVISFAKTHPSDAWITGGGWDYSIFPDKRLPTRADLDAAVRDRPVYLWAYDGHTGWVNSKALEISGVTAKSKVQGYGELVLDSKTGEPTGTLKESAQSLVRSAIPSPTRESQLAALREGFHVAASLGITSFQNASGNAAELRLYEELCDQGALSARVSLAMSVGAGTRKADFEKYAALMKSFPGPLLRVAAVKIMLDGVIESHTAAMLEPYSDGASTSGAPSLPQERLNQLVAEADQAGLQILIHAIGDRAVRMALDSYEHAIKVNGIHDARFRIEHIETITSPDIARFARLGLLASMQPMHADPGTNEVWEPAVGPERTKRAFAWRSLEQAGARLVFSSDWPATISVEPMRGIHNAVNRRTIDGYPPDGWVPDQRVSVETALQAYTINGAFASFEEKEKGSITPGKLADIVLLSQDLFQIVPMDIYKTKVVTTIFDGKVIYK